MMQTVLVMVRSSLVGAAIWDGRAYHVGWLAPGALALVTVWSLATITIKRRTGNHDKCRLVRALAQASRPSGAGLRSRVLPAAPEPRARQAR